MEFKLRELDKRKDGKNLFYTVIFCTFIALFLKFTGVSEGIAVNFIMSFSTGLLIFSLIIITLHVIKPKTRVSLGCLIILAVVIGWYLGNKIGSLLSQLTVSESISIGNIDFLKATALWILFGSAITIFFISKEKLSIARTMIQEERAKRLSTEKAAIEANLRLLQAQIEPHFLFNTLSNILSLLETDPEKGKSMLLDLMQFLRTSLSKTRKETSTIGQEMELIRAYLNIFKIRMSDRLRFDIDIPEDIKNISFPPMLIQPLIENAVKHGLESAIEGGEILVTGSVSRDNIRIEVKDTGPGFHENSIPGIGIENIKNRLKSLFGDKACLILEENRPSGLKAIIEVPYEKDQRDNS